MPPSPPVQNPAPKAPDRIAQPSEHSDVDAQTPAPEKKERAFNAGRFDNDPERARIAGRKGGANPNNAGRFDNNPARAREAGQKGGQSSQAARTTQ